MHNQEIVTLTLNENGSYLVTKASSQPLMGLAYFLDDDFFFLGYKKCRDFVENNSVDSLSGNLTFLNKEKNTQLQQRMICIASDAFDAEPPYLYLSPDNFLAILDAWEKIVESMPREVHLIMENGRVRLEVKKQ